MIGGQKAIPAVLSNRDGPALAEGPECADVIEALARLRTRKASTGYSGRSPAQ